MSNYSLVPAGSATVVDSKTKKDKPNTIRVLVPSVNTTDYPQFGTSAATVKGEVKQVVALDLPAAELTNPKFEAWDAFTAEASALGKDAQAKALEAVNDALALGAATQRRNIGKSLKTIPANPLDAFTGVASATVLAFFNGVQRAMTAKAVNERVAGIVANVDLNDPAAMAAAIAQMKAAMGIA